MAESNVDAAMAFPDLRCLEKRRIAEKLQEGLPPSKIALWFASNTIVNVLSTYSALEQKAFVDKLCENLILTPGDVEAILDIRDNQGIARLDRVCSRLQNRSDADTRRFIEVLEETPLKANSNLGGYLRRLVEKCKEVDDEPFDQITSNEGRVQYTIEIHTPKYLEADVIKKINLKMLEFQTTVLPPRTAVTAVRKQSILLKVILQDEWDIQNLKQNISSKTFHQRFINWLKKEGVNLTMEEQEVITVHIRDTEKLKDSSAEVVAEEPPMSHEPKGTEGEKTIVPSSHRGRKFWNQPLGTFLSSCIIFILVVLIFAVLDYREVTTSHQVLQKTEHDLLEKCDNELLEMLDKMTEYQRTLDKAAYEHNQKLVEWRSKQNKLRQKIKQVNMLNGEDDIKEVKNRIPGNEL